MVNPGVFRGSRKLFLVGEKPAYSEAVKGSYVNDALALISRRFFKRYHVDLPLDVEPTDEHLAAVDDDSADDEEAPPDPMILSEEEYNLEVLRFDERAALIMYRQAQIKRWMAYQYMKDNDVDPKDSGEHNPYRVLLFKLTNKGLKTPRLKTPANLWRVSHRELINDIAKREAPSKKDAAKVRDRIAREEFAKLDPDEHDEWVERSATEHEAAKERHRLDVEGPPSTAPEDRQRCIQGLSKFVEPILDLISEATGWKVTLIAGGPEPAHEGRLNILSVHSGTTSGEVKMNFGRFERNRYRKMVVPIFGNFLKNCYTIEECRARALPDSSGFEPLHSMEYEQADANLDSIGWDAPPTASSSSTSSKTSVAPGPPAFPTASSTKSNETSVAPVTPNATIAVSKKTPSSSHPRSTPSQHTAPIVPHPPAGLTAQTPTSSTAPSQPSDTTPIAEVHTPVIAPSPDSSTKPVDSIDQLPGDDERSPSPSDLHSMFDVPPSPIPLATDMPPSRLSSPTPDSDGSNDKLALPDVNVNAATSSGSLSLSPVAPEGTSPDETCASSGTPTLGTTTRKRKTSENREEETSGIDGAFTETNAQDVGKRRRVSTRVSTRSKQKESEEKETTSAEEVVAEAVKPSIEAHADRANTGQRTSKRLLEQDATAMASTSAPAPKKSRRNAHASRTAPDPTAAPAPIPRLALPPPPATTATPKPDWYLPIDSMLRADDMGPRWTELVDAWLAFEKQEKGSPPRVLSATNRPPAIGQWIARARRPTYRPPFDVHAFEDQFTGWWEGLQPSWRKGMSGRLCYAAAHGDWDALRSPGVNGIVSIMAGLFFWGRKAKGISELEPAWRKLMEDAHRAFAGLVN